MTETVHLPSTDAAKSAGIQVWMGQVLKLSDKVRQGWDIDDIHDLRVAMRRSRAIAEAFSEIDPSRRWRKLKKVSAVFFHALGDLRDAQIEQYWIKKLCMPGDALCRDVLKRVYKREKKRRRKAERAMNKFDLKQWAQLSQKLHPRTEFFPPESVVFERLAFSRLNEAANLLHQVRKSSGSAAWHRLRIALKRFRYVVENFLPQRYEAWAKDLKRMQDLLGEVHDLDLLLDQFRRQAARATTPAFKQWMVKIQGERKLRLQEFRKKTSRTKSPWIVWRAGFRSSHTLMAGLLPSLQAA